MRKRRNIPTDAEDYQASLGPGFSLESLVVRAQSSNPDEQFSAVQATRSEVMRGCGVSNHWVVYIIPAGRYCPKTRTLQSMRSSGVVFNDCE